MKQYTDITVLVDRSGSMDSIKESMESAYKEFIKAHQEVPSTRVSLIQFDGQDDQEIVYMDCPVTYADPLKIRPRGSTPLVDALAKAIDRTGQRLANKEESERPDQVLFVVITDGQENSSKSFRKSDVEKRVKTQTDSYKWRFIYLGANQDAIREASSYGISPDWAMTYNATNIGTRSAVNSVLSNTMAYVHNSGEERTRGKLRGFSETQRKEATESK